MRVTNKMMSNSLLSNINNNKNLMSKLEEQYTSGKKIQRPSDDPIIAVRALKLRTNMAELIQYKEKNIPDARSWMEMTEGALKNVNAILLEMNTSCNQGTSDPLTPKDRTAIMQELLEKKQQIYQEGNTNLAGRYVFTGYKTDSSLTFQEDVGESKGVDLTYTDITDIFKGTDIKPYTVVIAKNDADGMPEGKPEKKDVYRLTLSYKDIKSQSLSLSLDKTTGITEKSIKDADAYDVGDDDIHFIKETGELIFGKDAYKYNMNAKGITATYDKSSFDKGDLKPEHYFDCKVRDNITGKEFEYKRDTEGQRIQYEVNFNQKLEINVEGFDAFKHAISRTIDDIEKAVSDVTDIEKKIDIIKDKLKDKNLSVAENEQILSNLEEELKLKSGVMREAFSRGITVTHKQQDVLNTQVSDIGSRIVRLNLTESRLEDQEVEFTDLLSNNEDVDLFETYVKFTSAQSLYMASLSATAKSLQNSLLDFL